MTATMESLLKMAAFPAEKVEAVLDPDTATWVNFDPELGYTLGSMNLKDGIDGSRTTYTYETAGHRRMINYAEHPCRINTFGNSYTQCHQVSDGETWQERLAAHLGEPIRNYGIAGSSVNCAYRRALRVGKTESATEYVVLNIFDDDHIRSIDGCRWIRLAWDSQVDPGVVRHLSSLPWAHVRYDLDRGEFVDRPGACPNVDALRALSDPDHFYETFKDDVVVKLFVIGIGGDADVEEAEALADRFNVDVDFKDPDRRRPDAWKLYQAYGLKSTPYIIEKLRQHLNEEGRKLMIQLSYSAHHIEKTLNGEPRFDQEFIDYMDTNDFVYVDTAVKFVEDYKKYNLTVLDYLKQFYILPTGSAIFGHFNPMANLFYAFAVKDEIVEWMDPKPPAYR